MMSVGISKVVVFALRGPLMKLLSFKLAVGDGIILVIGCHCRYHLGRSGQ